MEESYAYGVVEHPFPLNCFLRDWNLGADFYHAVKIGIVQYVCTSCIIKTFPYYDFWNLEALTETFTVQMILKLICALLAMILQAFGVYGEGKFEWRYG